MKDLSEQLRWLKGQSLYRSRRVLGSAQGAEVLVDGKRFLAFCSNDYLGLANHPAVIRALQTAAAKYGVGSGAAHLVTGHSVEHHALEEELADFTGRPRALLFSTGYMANMGVVSALLARGDTVYEDRLNHASLLDGGLLSGARLVRYAHANSEALGERMAARRGGEAMVLTDGVFSMDGDFAPLPELAEIAREHRAWMMVDDAHGFGVVGDEGKGTVASLGLGMEDVPIVVGTLGKAFGTAGAFVAGCEELIETLIQRARTYIFTTATPPALAAATRVSLSLARTEEWRRERLRTLVERFRVGAAQLGLTLMNSHTPIQPVLVGESDAALALADRLRAHGVVITPIRPPTVPAGSARLRVTFSAAHNEGHVDRLLDAFEAVGAGRTRMDSGCPCPETAERV